MVKSKNATIAKNTIFLYFRMMFTMLVSLYTSRIILKVLGIDDFGIYQTVGGVVIILSFLNSALSTSSSRFLTYELGRGDFNRLKRTFTSILTVHIILAGILLIFAETIGLWFVYNKLIIPSERLTAAIIAYHLSTITMVVNIIQVPYNACIFSHEKMNIYAYISIVEVILRLAVVYTLNFTGYDKLVVYAILLCIVQLAVSFFYFLYSKDKFEEVEFRLNLDREILGKVFSYSGWSLIAAISIALNNQGTIILINLFFSPAVATARSIANQVNTAANQFIHNFRAAVNPQIVKSYAAGFYHDSKSLLLISTTFSYYMMLVLAVPICMVAEPLLQIWLGVVPEYTVTFLQITIVTSLFQVFDASFYTALYAKGQIKENALTSPILGLLAFCVVYILFRLKYPPTSLAFVFLLLYAILGLVQKPIMLIKIVGYKFSDIMKVFNPCFKVSFVSSLIPLLCYYFKDEWFPNMLLQFFALTTIGVFSVTVSVWIIGLDKIMRERIKNFIMSKIRNRNRNSISSINF